MSNVDKYGNPVKLTGRQKDAIYKRAKELKEQLRNGMCTKTECAIPTERNVNKMVTEMKNRHIAELFRDSMRAIGADPKDQSTERLRRI